MSPADRERFEAARRRWVALTQHLIDGIRASERITASDLGLVVREPAP